MRGEERRGEEQGSHEEPRSEKEAPATAVDLVFRRMALTGGEGRPPQEQLVSVTASAEKQGDRHRGPRVPADGVGVSRGTGAKGHCLLEYQADLAWEGREEQAPGRFGPGG